MNNFAKEVVTNCRVCTKAKYDRHPKRQELGVTPIPSCTGEMLHIDIFSTDKKQFLTCIEKFAVNPKKRLVIDFRKLNEQTISDRYPMPSIPMILANLGKAQFFTTLDLKSGYHQIYLEEHDREKTSFSANSGKYEFCRLPFGLKNASSIFQRALDDVLREHIGKICYVYIDDVIIFSNNEAEHVRHIDALLKCLIDANMRVSQEKTSFFKDSVEYLGFIVSKIRPSKGKSHSRRS